MLRKRKIFAHSSFLLLVERKRKGSKHTRIERWNVYLCYRISYSSNITLYSYYYTAAFCCTVYSKLALALVQIRRCIKINTSKAFVSSYYSNTTCFGPTDHHQVYKLQRKLLPFCHAATLF
jgi:hypothetical protein